MQPTMRLVACAAVALLAVLACSGSAARGDAQRIEVSVTRTVLASGRTFTATATASTRCTWVLEWSGQRRRADARRFVTTFTAPPVSQRTRLVLRARCYAAVPRTPQHGSARSAASPASSEVQTVQVTVPPSWSHAVVITVLPPGSVSPPHGSGGGDLPNTGGPARWLLLTGLALLLSGAAAVRLSRRTTSLPAFRE